MEAHIYLLIIPVLTVFAAMAVRHFYNCDTEMSTSLIASNRIDHLSDIAMSRYPQDSKLAALILYLQDLEQEIVTLKANALNTDVVYILQGLFRDKRLLNQECADLLRIELEYNSGFDVRAAAQA